MSRKYKTAKRAKVTGIETEGPSAGQLVCPEINLWRIDSLGVRKKRQSRIKHDEVVLVYEETSGPGGEKLYFVRHLVSGNIRGWVTARFLIFEEGEDA